MVITTSVSFTVARFAAREPGDRVPFLRAVAAANVLWAVVCVVLAVYWSDRASTLGLALLVGEAAFVGGLGVIEWRAASAALTPARRGRA